MKNLLEYVKSRSKDLDDIFIRRLCVDNNEINLVYNEALVDSTMISNFVVRSIVECIREEKILNDIEEKDNSLEDKINKKVGNKKDRNLEDTIAINKIKKIDPQQENIFYYIMSGFVLIIYKDIAYVVETRGTLTRGISEPTSENSIRGAKDSFVENIMKNIGLIRNRIKTENLAYKEKDLEERADGSFDGRTAAPDRSFTSGRRRR